MLFFPRLNQTAKTYKQAQALWAKSEDAYAVNNSTRGQWWLKSLLEESQAKAPAAMKAIYREKKIQSELRYWALQSLTPR